MIGDHASLQHWPQTPPPPSPRIAILDRTWRGARAALASEREINEKRQEKKKLADPLSLGDAVVLLKPGLPVTFKRRWSARWEVIRARHPVYWIRHLPSPGEEKVFNREKLRRVPDGVDWVMLPDTERQVDNTPTDDTPTPRKDTPSPAFHLPIPLPATPQANPQQMLSLLRRPYHQQIHTFHHPHPIPPHTSRHPHPIPTRGSHQQMVTLPGLPHPRKTPTIQHTPLPLGLTRVNQ